MPRDREIVQIDCEKRSQRTSAKLQGAYPLGIRHAAMSVDGKWVVSDMRGNSSPTAPIL